jgi:hypothetical protein
VHARLARRLLTAAIAASALGGALAVAPAASAAPSSSRPVLVNCQNKATVKPKQFIITCADGNDFLTGLAWSNWGVTASGKGTEEINTCNPNCAAGKFRKFGADVKLSRPKARPHHAGQRYFTRMTLTYTHKVPKGFHRHRTIDLWAHI